MAEKMKLEIVTPYRKVVDVEVDEVTATGKLGEFGILPSVLCWLRCSVCC